MHVCRKGNAKTCGTQQRMWILPTGPFPSMGRAVSHVEVRIRGLPPAWHAFSYPCFDFHTCKMTILHPNQGVCAVSPHRCTEHRRKTHILAHKYQSDKKFTATENVYLAWLFCHACEGRRTTCGNRLSPPTTWLPEIALRWSSLAASTFACWAPHQPLKHYALSFLHLLISSSWISRKHTS